MTDGDARGGALANCTACHTAHKANDFVFRNYVAWDN